MAGAGLNTARVSQIAAAILDYADGMSKVLKLRSRSRVVRHDAAQRSCPIPNPRSRKHVYRRQKPSHLLIMMLALALASLVTLQAGGEFSGFTGAQYSASQLISKPRSLRGGNAWNRSSGGSAGLAGQTISGRVTHVRDGDTLVVGDTPIRIANLDCAERGSLLGEQATLRARQIAAGQIITCRLNPGRSYDRLIARCTLPDGRDFGDVLIKEGACLASR